jgi:type I restriction enzyme S subunit
MREPSAWEEVRIGDLARGVRGVSYRPENLLTESFASSVTLLRSTNIQNSRLSFDDVQFVPEWLVSQSQILKPGDIAVCMSNGSKALVGKAARFSGEQTETFTVGAFCSVFKPNRRDEAEFVFHLFNSERYQRHVDLALAGSAINNLKNSSVESLVFKIPTNGQHRKRISAVLSCIDTAIDKTEALIAKHQQIKAGLMHDLFTRGVLPNGQLRPARSEAPELYRKTAVGWIPRNWQPLTLRELVGAGSIVNGPFGSDLLTHELRAEGIPVLYVQDIKPGAFTRVSNAHVTAQKANELAFCNVRRGDVLVAKVGGPPCDSCVYEDNLTAIVTQDVIRIRPSGEVDSVYLGALLNSSYGRKVIKKISIEGTRERVSLTEFKGLAFPIAQPDEQKHIAQWVVQMQAAITAERDKVEKLQKQKRGLMQDLLTGKVPVPINPDPADTTA